MELALQRIEEKRKRLNYSKNVFDFKNLEVIKYPSSSGKINIIDIALILPLLKNLADKRMEISFDDIKMIHKNIGDGCSGEFRKNDVSVRTRNGYNLVSTCFYINKFDWHTKFITWFNTNRLPVIKFAVLAHIKLVMLHPFDQGNGRLAHLLMNYILLKEGYPLIEITRVDCYLDLLKKINEDIGYFKILESDSYDEELSEFYLFIYEIIEESLDLALENYKIIN